MKKKIAALAIVAICFATLASSTLAFFTAEEEVVNVITSGGIDIAIEEWQQGPGGLIPYPEQPIAIMPGVTVSKIVTVCNLEGKSYIRATYEIVIKTADGKVMEVSEETLDKIIAINVDETKWTERDGWWYYTGEVATGDVTAPLFTEVAFSGPNMTNEYQNCTVEIIVSAQAVQTANNGASALEAAGWPET